MIGEAAQPVRTKRIGALVVSRDSERIEGLFSERDIVSDLPRHGERLLRLNESVTGHRLRPPAPPPSP